MAVGLERQFFTFLRSFWLVYGKPTLFGPFCFFCTSEASCHARERVAMVKSRGFINWSRKLLFGWTSVHRFLPQAGCLSCSCVLLLY